MACPVARAARLPCARASAFAGRRLRAPLRTPARSLISALQVQSEFKLVPAGGGGAIEVTKEAVVGSGGTADIVVDAPSEHARLSVAGTRYFCTDLESDGGTFFNGNKLWPGVQYLLAPGSTLAFGEESFTVDYEEDAAAGADAMAKMMMQGMLAGADDEVRKAVDESL